MTKTIKYNGGFPYQKYLGFKRILFEMNRSKFELPLKPEHMNFAGIPHGGVYSALLDSALGSAGCNNGSDSEILVAVTLNLNISFVAPPKGKVLFAEGRKMGGGKNIYFSQGEIFDELDVLVASATGTFKYL